MQQTSPAATRTRAASSRSISTARRTSAACARRATASSGTCPSSTSNVTNPGTGAVTAALSVPTGLSVIADARFSADGNGSGVLGHAQIREVGNASAATTDQNAQHLAPSDQLSGSRHQVATDTSGQVDYRMKASGASLVVQNMALQRFTRRSAEAAAGTGEAKDALRALGIQLRDGNGRMRDTESLFRDAADAVAKIEGSAGLDEFERRARGLGVVASRESVRSLKKLSDSFTDLLGIVKGFGLELFGRLGPAIRAVLDQFTAWWAVNRELGLRKAEAAARDLGGELQKLGEWLAKVVPPTWRFIKAIGGLKTVVIGLGVAIALSLIAPLAVVSSTAALVVGGLVVGAGVIMAAWDPLVAFFGLVRDTIVDTWTDLKKLVDLIPSIDLGALGGAVSSFFAGPAQPAGSPRAPLLTGGSTGAGAVARAQVGGLIRVRVEGGGRAELVQQSGPVGLEVDSGLVMLPGTG